jgi:hypothetical protein
MIRSSASPNQTKPKVNGAPNKGHRHRPWRQSAT